MWVPVTMTCPLIAERGDDLQIWRVAANILNKQLWMADKGWSSNFGFGRRANNLFAVKKQEEIIWL